MTNLHARTDVAIDATVAPERDLLAAQADYLGAFDVLLALAERELRVFDPNLAQLDLDAPERVDALGAFLRRGATSRLYVAVHDTDHLQRHLPRLARLFALFSTTAMVSRTLGEAARVADCFVLADRDHFLRRPVAVQPRGVFVRHDPREAALMRERFEQIWESSEPAAPPTTLGL